MSAEVPVPDTGEVVSAITVALAGLVPSDARVAQVILGDPGQVIRLSITELAELAGTASSTVVHACKALGYRGFQDLKLALAKDLGGAKGVRHAELPDNPAPGDVLRSVLSRSAQTLMAGLNTVDDAAFAAAVKALRSARRILVAGFGTSRAPAEDIAYRLSLIGRDVSAPGDVLALHHAARRLRPGDVLLAVSYTGGTRETVETADLALERGATVIALTSHRKSLLTERATLSLVAGAPEGGFRLEAMTSRLAHLALADALYVAVAYADPEVAASALDDAAAVTAIHSF
ncbi:MAG TPA: MurR/RpiR family transcriptional regulator [Streptosporangiaceae bacterium]|jgi:DNA-binding MurR/RpiR family transcriptional regulator